MEGRGGGLNRGGGGGLIEDLRYLKIFLKTMTELILRVK